MTQISSLVLLSAKIISLIALSLYLVFAYVVVKQVSVMTKIVSGNLNLQIKLLSKIHFILAVLVLILAFVVL